MSDRPARPPAPVAGPRRPRLVPALLLAAAVGAAGCGDGGGPDGGRGVGGAASGRDAAEGPAGAPGPGPAGAAGRGGVSAGPPRSGERLARELGCGACHDGVGGDPGRRAPPLPGRAAADPAWTFAYLGDPGAYATGGAAGRMPGFHLDEAERLALALFLAAGDPDDDRRGAAGGAPGGAAAERRRRAYRAAREAHPAVDGARGRAVFVALNCAGCHPHPEVEPWRAGPDLGREARRARPAWLRAWLRAPTALRPFGHRPGTGSRMPDFRLAAAEADSLAAFLTRERDPSAGAPDPEPASPYRRWKAAALLRERLSCLGCHRLGGEGGRVGPALDAVAARRHPEWIAAMVRAPGEAVPGTVMPAPVLPEETRRLLVGFLGTLEEAAGPGARDPRDGYLSLVDHPLLPPPAAAPGEAETYARLCATCHGPEGRGDGYNARYLPVTPTPHASAEHMSTRPSSTLFDGIHAGGRILGRSPRMPAFGGSLDAGETWDLVVHLRRLCRCTGPAWSRDNGELPGRVRSAGAGERPVEREGPGDGGGSR